MELDPKLIASYEEEGAVLLPGIFKDWVDLLRNGVEENLRSPGPYGAENLQEGEKGRFFDDYCNWQRIEAFQQFIEGSPVAEIAGKLMKSETVQLFHDHVLIKEPGTAKATPWHQDSPYYFVEGEQTLSFWIPLDPVAENSLRLIAGSHKWEKPVLPVRWAQDGNFYSQAGDYLPVPDPDAQPEDYQVLEWPMEPGDAVAFHYRTVHGARGNFSPGRRRAFSLRLLGEDARYTSRPGRTSPPFPGHGMIDGERLREDWFPLLRRDLKGHSSHHPLTEEVLRF